MSNRFSSRRPMPSFKASDGLIEALSSTSISDLPSGRCCAFCLHSLKEEKAVKGTCSACHRRVYCSKECQTADWKAPKEGKPLTTPNTKAAVYGQGHKNWCPFQCGEEGLDWAVKRVGGRPGLVALKDIPALTRIIVEGYQNHGEPVYKDHPGFLTIMGASQRTKIGNKISGMFKVQQVRGKAVFGFRSYFGNHSCAANSYLADDSEYRVLIMYSIRDIKEGEEITFQYEYLQFNDIYRGLPNLKTRAKTLRESFDHLCKPDCICKDQTLRGLLLELQATKEALENLIKKGETEKAFKISEAMPELMEKAAIPPAHESFIDQICLQARIARGIPASEALPLVRKILGFREKVWHPNNPNGALYWKNMEQSFMNKPTMNLKLAPM